MRMQDPEEQQWQPNLEYGAYRASDSWQQEPEQAQKIQPQEERRLGGKILAILAIVLSSVGFFFTVAGIVASALVLHYASLAQGEVQQGGQIGLASSIIAMLAFTAIFVIAVVTLARRSGRIRRQL